jgi:hypothetical protein
VNKRQEEEATEREAAQLEEAKKRAAQDKACERVPYTQAAKIQQILRRIGPRYAGC